MLLQLCRMFLWLMIYSFIGWVYESTLCSITAKSPVNRGFLNGPVCPVYGFGALIVILTLEDQADHLLVLFLSSILLTGVLEYVTSWALEYFFKAKLWDYSKWPFNIGGRVCLYGALVFGTLSVLVVRVVHPVIRGFVDQFSPPVLYLSSAILLVLVLFDLFVTVRHMLTLNGRLAEIQEAIDQFREENARHREELMGRLASAVSLPDAGQIRQAVYGRLGEMLTAEELAALFQEKAGELQQWLEEKFESSSFHTERIQKLLSTGKAQTRRLMRAFPGWTSTSYKEALETLRERLEARSGDDDKEDSSKTHGDKS